MGDADFGKYRLIGALGQGGMADVFLAVQQGPAGFSKLTVIKRLRASLAEDPEFVAMLVDEARIAARLNHPNVVQTNEVGELNDVYFIAMEYLDGQPLSRFLHRASREKVPISLAMHLRIIADVLSGLHHAHELKHYDGEPLHIVHRDVTPQNIFVTYDGQIKIVDFGIAKAAGRTTETRTGMVKGKIGYMPVEQAVGANVDRRADIFAVGVMLFEAVAGRRMWKGMVDMAIMQALINGDIPSIEAAKPDAPAEVKRIIAKATSQHAADRYETALELQNDIENYIVESNTRATNREIGRLLSTLYADKRTSTKELIELQLANVSAGGPVDLNPVSMREPVSGASTPSSLSMPRGRSGSLSKTLTSGAPSEGTVATVVTGEAVPSARRGSRTLWIAVPAIGIAAGALWFATQSARTGAAASAQSGTPPVSTAPSAPAASGVELRVTVTPSSATIKVDDKPAKGSPLVLRMPRDASVHTVTLSAPGFVDRTEKVRFEHDVQLDIALAAEASANASATPAEPAEAAGSAAPTRAARAPAHNAATPPPPTPGKKPKRQIDTTDPWSQ